jgi:hypothetical protein
LGITAKARAGGLNGFIPTLRVIKPHEGWGTPFFCGWLGRTTATAKANRGILPFGFAQDQDDDREGLVTMEDVVSDTLRYTFWR